MKKKTDQENLDIDPNADVPEDNIDETAASDSIKAHGVPSRLDVMTNTISAMAKMNDTDLTKWYRDAIQTSQGYSATGLSTSDKNKASINMKPSATGANPMGPFPYVPVVKEDLKAVFDAMGITEADLQEKTLTLFEAAVNARVTVETVRIQEEFDNKLIEEVEAIRQDLVEKVDQYLDYAAQEFVTENEVAIENALRLELFEDFMTGFRDLCESHYVTFPEDKLDVMTSLSEKVVELEGKLNEALETGLAKDQKINEMIAQKTFAEVSEGLTVADTTKFKTLVETVEFDGDVDALKQKLNIIKEANFKGPAKKAAKTNILQEQEEITLTGDVDEAGNMEVTTDPRVSAYVAAINRTMKNAVK